MSALPAVHTTLELPEHMQDNHDGDPLLSYVADGISDLRRAVAAAAMSRVRIVPPFSNPDVWNV